MYGTLGRLIRIVVIVSLCVISSFANAGLATFSERGDVQLFIRQMAEQYDFDPVELSQLFSQVKLRHIVVRTMASPKEAAPWFAYRRLFITPHRIDAGVAFWNQHEKALAAAQKKYGVPANIIVAIIGVETNYGKDAGNYRVLDTLSTLAFTSTPRRKFFHNELIQFLLLSREQGFDPLTVYGSYAGAIGVPQFMPSSYRKYAVSINGKSKADIIHNSDDAIVSVGNYFNKYGWEAKQPISVSAQVKGNDYVTLLHQSKPQLTLADFAKEGVIPARHYAAHDKAVLFVLKGMDSNEYWLGFDNFYVIMGYNPTIHYAMAVYQLAQAIEVAKKQQQPKLTTAEKAPITVTAPATVPVNKGA